MTTTYIIIFSLSTPATERETLAAELVADGRAHLRDGERLELEGVAERELH